MLGSMWVGGELYLGRGPLLWFSRASSNSLGPSSTGTGFLFRGLYTLHLRRDFQGKLITCLPGVHSHQQLLRPPSSPCRQLLRVSVLVIFANLMGVKQYLVVLICI